MPVPIVNRYIQEKPLLLWVVADQVFANYLSSKLNDQSFKHQIITISALEKTIQNQANHIYKILFVLNPIQVFNNQEIINQSLSLLRKRPVIFCLPWAAQVEARNKEDDLAEARSYFKFQKQVLQHVLSALPNCQIVLAEELFLKEKPWFFPSTSYYCCQQISQLKIVSFEALPNPLIFHQLIDFLLELATQPHQTQSYLIHSRRSISNKLSSQSMLKRVANLYQQMFQVKIGFQELPSEITNPSLISKEKNVDLQEVDDLITNLAQSLPSPTKELEKTVWALPSQGEVVSKGKVEMFAKKTSQKRVVGQVKKRLGQKQKAVPEISEEISNLFRNQRVVQKKQVVSELTNQELVFRHKRNRRKKLFYGGVVFISLGIAVLLLMGGFLLSEKLLKNSLGSAVDVIVEEKNISQQLAKKLSNRSKRLALQAKTYSSLIDNVAFDQALELQDSVQILIELNNSLFKATQSAQILAHTILTNSDGDVNSLAQKTQTEILEAHKNLSLFQSKIESNSWLVENWGDLDKMNSWLASKQKSLVVAQRVIPIISEIINQSPTQKWLIIFQNDQELRPTGGFIQAVAILNFNQGKLSSQQTHSSYQVDALVPGRVIPPEDIKKYLNEDNFYFRDSNWDPNFPTAANRMLWFLNKAYQIEASGIISITPSSLESVIDEVGPIDLPEFNEVVTADNLRERLEFHSSVQIDPTKEKNDYSTLLLKKTIDALMSAPDDKTIPFLEALYQQLNNQEIQVYSINSGIESSFSSLGWAGELLTPSCPSQFTTNNCLVDSIAQVEANIGVNKANAYIRRKVQHTINLNGEKALHIRKISYENTAKTAAWPKGPYKAYVRFYLPESSMLEYLAINNQRLDISQISLSEEHLKKVVGTTINVPVRQTLDLEIGYSTITPVHEGVAYLLFNQKQSGGGEQIGQLIINFPQQLTPQIIAPRGEIEDGRVVFNLNSDSHSFSGIQF